MAVGGGDGGEGGEEGAGAEGFDEGFRAAGGCVL